MWLGDLNVAPEPIDVYHPDKRVNDRRFPHRCPDRLQGRRVRVGIIDVYRKLIPTGVQYTYWDYYQQRVGAEFRLAR